MRKKRRKEEILLIDLSSRENIKIVHSKKTVITDEEFEYFEKQLDERYKKFSDFTNFCIQKNIEKNKKTFSEQSFSEAMESMLQQNQFLKFMLESKEQEN